MSIGSGILNKTYFKSSNIPMSSQNESQKPATNAVYTDVKTNPQPANQNINEVLKANVLPNQGMGYKKINTFNAPFLDKGHIYKLDNGQKVVIIPKKGPTTLKTYVKVGAFNEPDNLRGISHYIEHSVFNGSSKLAPGEFVKNVTNMGGRYNAGTGFSSTNYFIQSPLHKKDDFNKFVQMHSDMIQHPTFSEDMIEKERGPVISEINMYEDDPQDKAYNLSLKNLFNFKNKYQGLIAGSEANIKNLKSSDVKDYYSKWYTPDNMTTIVIGEVDPDNAVKTIAKYFNKKTPASETTAKYKVSLDNPTQQPVRKDIQNPNTNSVLMNMTFVGPKNNDIRESLAVNALSQALTGHETSVINKALKPLNTSADSELDVISADYNDPQVIQINSTFDKGTEEKGIKAVYSAIQHFAQTPMSNDELTITKNKLKDNFIKSNEYAMNISEAVGDAIIDHGDISAYSQKLDMINNLTAQDIQNAAKKYLDLNKTSMVVVHPEETKTNTKQTSFSGKIRFGSSQPPNKTENIKEFYLNNNFDLIMNNNQTSNISNAIIQLKTDTTPNAKPGVAPILATMLSKGSKHFSEDELNKLVDKNNLGISSIVDNNKIVIDANCDAAKMPMSLGLMKEIVYNPNFSKENFQKAKEETKFMYSSLPENPLNKAIETLYPNSPNGYSAKTITQNIDNVTIDDVKTFYNQLINNAQGKAIVTLKEDQSNKLQNTIMNSIGNLPSVKKPAPPIKEKYTPLTKNMIFTTEVNRKQAHVIQMFKINESGNAKDQAALLVLNEILGGNSQSRLFQDLREKQNLGYKVKSHYSNDSHTGELTLEIKTTTKDNKAQNNDQINNLKKSLDGFKKHVNNLITTPVTNEELNGAKLSVKSNMIFDAEDSSGKSNLVLNGCNSQYGTLLSKELFKEIDKLSIKDIQNAAKLYLKQPSVTSIIANKDTINASKNYLQQQGELKMS